MLSDTTIIHNFTLYVESLTNSVSLHNCYLMFSYLFVMLYTGIITIRLLLLNPDVITLYVSFCVSLTCSLTLLSYIILHSNIEFSINDVCLLNYYPMFSYLCVRLYASIITIRLLLPNPDVITLYAPFRVNLTCSLTLLSYKFYIPTLNFP